jgi:hypothetical protein
MKTLAPISLTKTESADQIELTETFKARQLQKLSEERQALKSRDAISKRRMLRELEMARQNEISTLYQMQRQQLRHDQAMAKRTIEELERLNNIFGPIEGEDFKQKVVVEKEERAEDAKSELDQ